MTLAGSSAHMGALDPAHWLWIAGLSSVRTLAALALVPVFASHTVPALVRTATAMAVSAPVIWRNLGVTMVNDLGLGALATLFAKEAAIGLVIGLGFGVFLAGLQMVGDLIDHQTGLTFSQNIDPVHGNQVSLTAQFLERLLFAALMLAGLLHGLLDALYLSYTLWPVDAGLPNIQRADLMGMVAPISRLFALAILLAGPSLLILYVVDAGMGLLNRAAPQLSLFQISMSLKSLLSLGVLVLALPSIVGRALEALPEVTSTLTTLLRSWS